MGEVSVPQAEFWNQGSHGKERAPGFHARPWALAWAQPHLLELWEDPLHHQPPAPGSSLPCFMPQCAERWEDQFLF